MNADKKQDNQPVKSMKITPLDENDFSSQDTKDPNSKDTKGLDPQFTEKTDATGEAKADVPPPISFFKLYRYATNMDLFLIFIGALFAILTGAVTPVQMLVFGKLTDDMVDHGADVINWGNLTEEDKNELSNEFLDALTEFALNYTYLGIVTLGGSYISVALLNYTALRQIFQIRSLFFKKTLNQDVSWFDLNQSGEFTSRMAEDLTKMEDGIGEKTVMFLHHQIAFVGSLVLAFVKGWELALICMISFPITFVTMLVVGKVTAKYARQEMEEYGKAGAIAEEVLSAIRTVVAFGGQEREIMRYSERLIYARDNNIKRSMFFGLGFGMLWFFIYGTYALAFWYGVGLVIDEAKGPEDEMHYTPGVMITVFLSVMMGSFNFGMSTAFIESFSIGSGAAAKVFSIIDTIPKIDASSDDGKKPSKITGGIKFTDVHFEYPSRSEVKILQGLNLTIDSGETVALVGTSGCGKSTCIQLIQRLYDPRSGVVAVDGEDVRNLNVRWLRQQIGVVGQEPVLFSNTIAENIRYGNPEATEEQIKSAAMKANAHDFIQTLPKGYNTLVGERGAQMSGGQKQRIAIARALVREPSILLLDEATSALDTSSEAKVQRALDKASVGRTTIIVAHRLSTIRGANKIVVISEGVVAEQGSHEELMAKKGHYFNLVTAQVGVSDDIPEDEDEFVNKGPMNTMRQISTMSATSSEFEKRSSSSSQKDVRVTDLDDIDDVDDSKPNKVSMIDIVRYNSNEWFQITCACICSFLIGGAMPVFSVIFGDIIGVLSQAKYDPDYVRDESNFYALMFIVLGVVTGVSTFIQQYMFGIAGERLTMRIRSLLFEGMLRQEMGWFDDPSQGTGTLCSRLSVEAASVQGATGSRIGTVLQSISTLALAFGLSMYYEWRLALVALAFSPFILVATYLERSVMRKRNTDSDVAMERANKLAVEAVTNIRTVVSLGRETAFHAEYVEALVPSHKTAKRSVHFRGLVFGSGRSLMFFAFAACMVYGGHIIVEDGVKFEDVMKVSQALIMGTVSIAQAFAFAPNFQKGLTAAGNIFALLKRKPKIADYPGVQNENWQCVGNVKYEDVCFTYPTRPDTRVLRGLNLSIEHGKTVALVGPSGCGKSTIVQLLERFYDPNSGRVMIDQRGLQDELSLATVRAQLGIVSQEPTLFDRTIEDNIAYGDNTRTVHQTEIIEAAKKANIHNFITTLPLGYNTRLGDKGTQLSGGQKQRVAIARALIRNPRILLLDEATSALDTESEQVVQDALDKAKLGRTCITIAHRLSTIQDADVICVLHRGQITEIGTHNELLAQRGLYYQLHKLQGGQQFSTK